MYTMALAVLLNSIGVPAIGLTLVIAAIAALVFAGSVGIAIIIAAQQGRANVTVSIRIGTTRRRSP